jgi:hypothetical protein
MNPRTSSVAPGATAAILLLSLLALLAGPLGGQDVRDSTRTVVTAAGAHYRAGALHRLVLGRHYRDLWMTPMEVEVLDLSTFAGGIEPLRTGGGRQTKSLRFLGADGREYSFRSVDKDPSPVLDSLLRDTFVDDLVQDGISAAHPLGALVAAPLLEAAGILHVDPELRVMPDDPALGDFREEFAGMLGLIEERPNENQGGSTAFQGAVSVIASETLTERLEESPSNRVDARAFLTARIMDVFLGDWDRHRGQWRWATYGEEEPRAWLPVPTDRDQAFSKFDGIATRIVSLYMPQFVRFEEDYPGIERLHWNGRALDRWFLSGLERPVWDSIGASLQARLDDSVIDEAVGRLPPEIFAQNGEELAATLRIRRDNLDQAWDAFYRLLAAHVDVHATAASEVLVVDRSEPGQVTVILTAPAHDEAPYFRRSFSTEETREVRVYLGGGDDRVAVRGGAGGGTTVRIIGGPGDDTYEVDGSARGIRLYDSQGDVVVSGPVQVDPKHFEEWVWTEEDRDQPRDWGGRTTPIFWTRYSSDLGLFVGGGLHREWYGFRKRPYSTGVDVRGGWSVAESKGRLEIDARVHGENTSLFGALSARFSGLDVINYYGLGNDAPSSGGDFHKLDHKAASLQATLGLPLGDGLTLSAGVVASWTETADNAGRYFETLSDSIYGADDFLRLGATAGLQFDPLAESERTANRIRVSVEGTTYPDFFGDVERSFAQAEAQISALLAPSPSAPVSLAIRAGGEQVWGRFPWSEAAFLGGGSTIRGWDDQRFAGDAALFLSSELRLRVGYARIVVPVGVGVLGFYDVGRVFLDGSSPGGWHSGVGGGIWLQPMGQRYILRGGAGGSDEATKVYLALGLPY